jgi:hypothetical protein
MAAEDVERYTSCEVLVGVERDFGGAFAGIGDFGLDIGGVER